MATNKIKAAVSKATASSKAAAKRANAKLRELREDQTKRRWVDRGEAVAGAAGAAAVDKMYGGLEVSDGIEVTYGLLAGGLAIVAGDSMGNDDVSALGLGAVCDGVGQLVRKAL